MKKYQLITNSGDAIGEPFSWDRLVTADQCLNKYNSEIDLLIHLSSKIPALVTEKHLKLKSENHIYNLIFDHDFIECGKQTHVRGGTIYFHSTDPFLKLCHRIQSQLQMLSPSIWDSFLAQIQTDNRIDESFVTAIYRYRQITLQQAEGEEDLHAFLEREKELKKQLYYYKKMRAYLIVMKELSEQKSFEDMPSFEYSGYQWARNEWLKVYGEDLSFEEYQDRYARPKGMRK